VAHSLDQVGYRVCVEQRAAFTVVGYTLIVPPGDIGAFWDEVWTDGRLERLVGCSKVRPWVLGLGSWDPECPRGGQRYTICIEGTEDTDFTGLAGPPALFTKAIGASLWLRFELPQPQLDGPFWRDDPYRMMGLLGYRFNRTGFDVGLHFDAYPPDYDPLSNPGMEFWITVLKV
jgi:hypothetical protein